MKDPLSFQSARQNTPVLAFGIEDFPLADQRLNTLRAQVDVLDFRSNDDFIVKLKTRTDHIVLAKVKPEQTLEATWKQVLQRMASPNGGIAPAPLTVGERLSVPVVSMNISHSYAELQKRLIENTNYTIRDAKQLIKFQLDESGARLESSSIITYESGGHEPTKPPDPRTFVFDHPFLLATLQRNTDTPYLLLWIANSELLVPAQGNY